MTTDNMFIINNVRCSYPHLFRRPVINGEEGKCGTTLLLDPVRHAAAIRTLESCIAALIKERFKGRKLASDKLCLRDGDDSGKPEYEGCKTLSASNRGKPLVIGKDPSTIVTDEEDNAIYAGCHVNAKIRLWAQDNSWGRRINAELVAIQFARDGEPLDGSYVSIDDAMTGFDAVGGGEDDFLAA